MSRVRDLVLLDIGVGRVLVVACDSVGSIGPKPQDSFHSSGTLTAHCAIRVALLEVLSAGASPELIVDTLSVEMDPTGAEMITEFRRMAASIGLDGDRVMGSTEDNVPTVATGIGVTVIGSASRDTLRPGTSHPSDLVLCLGTPTSAPADTIVMDDPRMVSLATLRSVLGAEGVHDSLPVGSHGAGYELAELAATADLILEPFEHDLDLEKTGGPASCVLVTVSPDRADAVLDLLPTDLPRAVLGRLEARL